MWEVGGEEALEADRAESQASNTLCKGKGPKADPWGWSCQVPGERWWGPTREMVAMRERWGPFKRGGISRTWHTRFSGRSLPGFYEPESRVESSWILCPQCPPLPGGELSWSPHLPRKWVNSNSWPHGKEFIHSVLHGFWSKREEEKESVVNKIHWFVATQWGVGMIPEWLCHCLLQLAASPYLSRPQNCPMWTWLWRYLAHCLHLSSFWTALPPQKLFTSCQYRAAYQGKPSRPIFLI